MEVPRGTQRLVIQACKDLPGDLDGFVKDSEIARQTGIRLADVRVCLKILGSNGWVALARLESGYKVHIEPEGELALSQEEPFLDRPERQSAASNTIKIVPKGLRSFDAEDKDFFLELLPGPRRGDGLPESVHFWKLRIEEMDSDKTFRVGYIFGPSGCGKSSLVKAGLLPRLSKPIISIYIEATGEETEARLLRGLRKHNPDLPADLDLRSALVAAREKTREGSNKILLVIDQFEQWYHAKGAEPGTELAKALSECDGGRVQAIILVRDDFSMALHRFMAVIGVRQNQDQNFAVVDLFDLQHARKVLIAFGRGYGMLPDDPKEMTGAQNDFLDRTIKGLSQEGRVVSVRLALFAEMLKGKPWTPETLKQVGGAAGVGVTFLEETFSARTAPPSYRIHQKAAQAVLRALLPETGSNIKGNMRSYGELLEVSGYGSRPNEFDELLRILNSELRLISPIEPEGSESDGQTKMQVGEKFFLLTHDYLVPSIREWLTRKQKETQRGRAELLLVDRSSLWNAKPKPENRYLPSLLEWANISLLTRKKDWTEPQHKMMRKAGWVHGSRTLAALILLGLLTWGGIEGYGTMRASSLVESLRTASTTDVPALVRQLDGYRRWANPRLKTLVENANENSREKLHASLALLPADAAQVNPLYDWMVETEVPEVATVISQSLEPHSKSLKEDLWTAVEQARPGDKRIRPAASALARYEPENDRWVKVSDKVAQALVSVNSVHLGPWMDALRPVKVKLKPPLATIFRDKKLSESERTQVTNILADYASDDPDLLADLLLDSEEKPFAVLFDKLKARQKRAVPVLVEKLDKAKKASSEAKDDEKDQLAQRQARAAVALVRLGQGEKVWNLLRHSPDPSVRSYIVNWLKPLGAGPEALITKLEGIAHDPVSIPKDGKSRMDAILFHPETSERRALILALGKYNADDLSPTEREPLMAQLLEAYRTDPDAGVHGAAESTLRQWKQQEKLQAANAELMKQKDRGERRWYVNSEGQTFVVIEGPVEFSMGSPPTETERTAGNEDPRRMRIPRRFAIAAKEVTVEQFQRFLQLGGITMDRYQVSASDLSRFSPDPEGPWIRYRLVHGGPLLQLAERARGIVQGWAFTGVVAVALPRSSRASMDTTGRPLVFQATVPGLYPLRAA